MRQDANSKIPKNELSVSDLLNKIAGSLEQKYHMQVVGIAISMPRGVVKELGLDFQIQGPLSREDIRKILVYSAQEFLALVNADKVIKPYLQNQLFEIKDIDISLFMINSRDQGLDDPYIGIAGIANGRLIYKKLLTTDVPSIKSEFEESYEEAIQALQDH